MSTCHACGSEVEPTQPICSVCGQSPDGASSLPDPIAHGRRFPVRTVVQGGLIFLLAATVLVALLLTPGHLAARQESRFQRSLADLRVIAVALESYAAQQDGKTGYYPVAGSTTGLARFLVPKHVDLVPTVDAWGNPLRYLCWQQDPAAKGCDTYRIVSSGRDGQPEHADLKEYPERAVDSEHPNHDLALGPKGLLPAAPAPPAPPVSKTELAKPSSAKKPSR